MRGLQATAVAVLLALSAEALSAGLVRAPEILSSCCCHHRAGEPCPCGDCDLDHARADRPGVARVQACGPDQPTATLGQGALPALPADPITLAPPVAPARQPRAQSHGCPPGRTPTPPVPPPR